MTTLQIQGADGLVEQHQLDPGHPAADVERVGDRVAILDRGRQLVESDIGSLLDRYAAPVYEVELAPADLARVDDLARRLAARPWVAGVDRNGRRLRLRTPDAGEAGRRLVAEFAAAGAVVDRLEHVRPSLEEVFLAIVEGGQGGPGR